MTRPVKVGITHGDINGIGYEVILGAIGEEGMTDICTPVIFGYHALAEKARKLLGLDSVRLYKAHSAAQAQPGRISVVEISPEVPEHNPGMPTEASGKAAVASLEVAMEALEAGDIDVLVTAPISKEAVQSEEFKFPGHTEYLEAKAGEGYKSRMILFDDTIRVALVSTHLPVAKLAAAVTRESVGAAIESLRNSLKQDFGIVRPCIAVLSLNPHAGDGGLLGTEEQEVIIPAINEARENGTLAFGPFAADGFFGVGDYRKFDGIVAMYHDQGLAPFKALAGERGVNFTAGLPFVRTSPDHGTAFGIAWKGEADPTSMREAIYKAIDLLRNRERYLEASANPLRKIVVERPDKGERQEKPERTDKPERNDKPERTEKGERNEKNNSKKDSGAVQTDGKPGDKEENQTKETETE
ncbi:MAG: 4-hydroxythreonine-4-phosphate dehydrogenase PdxA [Muribaculaceae bacterium]|nr:4-hydroxythreonine-4-phosphate dehydrogenase PdxA [Muribaculaceae bacterium]